MCVYDLVQASLFLDGLGGVVAVPAGPNFYASIKDRPDLGDTMVSLGTGQGQSTRWEMHPSGEEILVILEGTPQVLFEHPDGRLEALAPAPGEAVIVPRGAWHRTVGPPGWKILYITYGAGTVHKPVTA
jgi:mannose-6-phosphate isomerase-like protein (cupin superfamily)